MRPLTASILLAPFVFPVVITTASVIRSHTHQTFSSDLLCKPCLEAFSQGHPVTGLCAKTSKGVECFCAERAAHPDPQNLQTCDWHPCNSHITSGCDPATSTCVATIGLGYRCDCLEGFAPSRSPDSNRCVQKFDPCSHGTDTCDRLRTDCVYDPPDQYYCKPKRHIKALMNANTAAPKLCGDQIDVCDRTSTRCVTTASGTFECECLDGYKPNPNPDNPYSCLPSLPDVTPCASGNKCDLSSTKCENTGPDSYNCSCLDGLKPVDEFHCEAYDLCLAGEHSCDLESTTCKANKGGYTCPCKTGFKYKDAHSCTQIKYCSTDANKCDTNTTKCVDLGPGEFKCQCLTGYKPKAHSTDFQSCTAINFCADNASHCDLKTTDCVFEGPAKYSCRCQKGFKRKDPYTCVLNDPCQDKTHKCDPATTTCQLNFPDDYLCICKQGFEKTSNDLAHKYFCTDIDECADTLNPPCDSKTSTCHNTLGSYECDCLSGYRHPTEDEMTEDNKNTNQVCVDIDECTELDENPCQAIFEEETKKGLLPTSVADGDSCTNLPGTYSCTCTAGFDHGDNDDPTQCFDINECIQRVDECNPHTTFCKNTRGSYNCPCQWGYKPTPPPSTTTEPSVSTTESTTHNSIPEGVKVPGGFSCEDINECEEGLQGDPKKTVCDPERSLCSNSIGGYSCNCYKGFYQADKAIIGSLLRAGCKSTTTPCCIDIDECNEKETTAHECSDICLSGLVEFPLNYTCACNEQRYFLDDKKRRCDNCGYEDWGKWGSCSVSCGSGVYTRTRKIKEGLGDTSPLCAKPEYTVMTKVCVMPPCDDTTQCVMSGWSEWSPCALTDGKPLQTRFRVIQAGETHCASYSLEESQACSLEEEEAPLEISWTHIGLACGGVTVLLGTVTFCAYHIHQRRNAPVYIY